MGAEHTRSAVRRVIIVDDADDVVSAMSLLVESIPNARVVGTGSSAADAVRLARSLVPHLAIIDVHMPGTGVAACQEIATSVPSTIVIAASAFDDAELRGQMRTAGAVDYLVKGSPLAEIRDRVAAWLDRTAPVSGP